MVKIITQLVSVLGPGAIILGAFAVIILIKLIFGQHPIEVGGSGRGEKPTTPPPEGRGAA